MTGWNPAVSATLPYSDRRFADPNVAPWNKKLFATALALSQDANDDAAARRAGVITGVGYPAFGRTTMFTGFSFLPYDRPGLVQKVSWRVSDRFAAALDAARADAQAAGDEKLASIKAEVDEFKEKKLAEINTQIGEARDGLKANLDGFATDMASKILGRAL